MHNSDHVSFVMHLIFYTQYYYIIILLRFYLCFINLFIFDPSRFRRTSE
jgi:hypothetical protein